MDASMQRYHKLDHQEFQWNFIWKSNFFIQEKCIWNVTDLQNDSHFLSASLRFNSTSKDNKKLLSSDLSPWKIINSLTHGRFQ